MRLPAALLVAVPAQAQSCPPAFPRPGATKLFENDKVVVWNIDVARALAPAGRIR